MFTIFKNLFGNLNRVLNLSQPTSIFSVMIILLITTVIIVFLLILIFITYSIIYKVINFVFKHLIKKLDNKLYDNSVRNAKLSIKFVSGILYLSVKIFAVLLCVSFISPNSLIFFGIFSLSLAIMFRKDLENLSAGLTLVFTNKLKIGDNIVIKDIKGRVKDLNISYILLDSENEEILIPNRAISKEIIVRIKENHNID
jgi:small-conductance mechanosensitive channel